MFTNNQYEIWIEIVILTLLLMAMTYWSYREGSFIKLLSEITILLPLFALWTQVFAPYNNTTSSFNQVLMLAPLGWSIVMLAILCKLNFTKKHI